MNQRLSLVLFIIGILLLVLPEAVVFYLIMPVPSSQESDQIELGHFLYRILWFTRIIGILFIIPFLFSTWRSGPITRKLMITGLVAFSLLVVFVLGYRFMPENVFKEPEQLLFVPPGKNTVPESSYVLGIEMNGEAKAYPLKFVGYHHKIQDVVGEVPVLVTYCTMCRTGMVYDPVINGKLEQFRLVGAAFNNAVIEDGTTKSWWYQSTGIAGAGPLKGTALKLFPYQQMTLGAWIQQHPNTLIMQPDPHFIKEYAKLKNYDINVPAANTDTSKNKSFLPNSWVLGVIVKDSSKAFLWNELTEKKVINTIVNHQPIVIALEPDGYSFHAWKATTADSSLTFSLTEDGSLSDKQTASTWNWKGECTSGYYAGKKLVPVPAYQTYYHSWERFYGNGHQKSPYSIGNNKFFQLPPDQKN